MSKKDSTPRERKHAAKSGGKDRGREDDKGSEMCEVWKERDEHGVDTRECGQGQDVPKL